MITVNKVGESITGSYVVIVEGKPVSKNYGVVYSEEAYKAMSELAVKAAAASSMADLVAITEEFIPLTVEDHSKTVESICPYLHVNPSNNKYFLKQGNRISKVAIPQSLVDRIITSYEKGIDVMPLIKFWTRLLRNPKFTPAKAARICGYIANTYVDKDLVQELLEKEGVSINVAMSRATGLQTPITQEGLLCTYKVSKEIKHKYILDEEGNKKKVDRYTPTKTINDITGEVTVTDNLPEFIEERIFEPAVVGQGYDAFYCGDVLGHIIKVGEVHKLESWSQVNCVDDSSCVKGLHVGNLDYIKGYQNAGTETHNVFVDPMHIGAVTNDGSAALRVKQYFVHSSFAGVNKTVYHSSEYAKLTDTEWAEMRLEAIKAMEKEADDIADKMVEKYDELAAL